MFTFEVAEATSAEGARVISNLRRRGFVAILGSVISDWQPTGLPPGESLTASVAELLAEPLVSRDTVSDWVRQAAFEHIMEGCPNPEVLGDNLLELFSPTNPNPLHQAIAGLVAEGVIEHVITTNYDVNLETACRTICSSSRQPQVITTEEEADEVDPHRPAIFKIHGCVAYDSRRDPSEARSMVYTLAREGELPAWKRRLLYRLMAGRHLLISGYSGRDFEICPELPRLQAQIVWNCRSDLRVEPDSITPNARHVLTATGGTALVGDMRSILGKLRGSEHIDAIRSERVPGLRDRLSNGLSEWDIELWRVRTLVAIGAASEGIGVATRMLELARGTADRQFNRLINLGRCQFNAGLYRQAAVTYRRAAAVGEREGRREWVIGAKSDLIEALRCRGAWRKALRELREVKAGLTPDDEWLHAAMALREVLLLRSWYQLVKGLKVIPMVAGRLRGRCRDLLKVLIRHAKEGHWLELQQAELLSRRLDIPFSELYNGPLNPLPSKDGYRHLGYIIAESMALRDHLGLSGAEYSFDRLRRMVEALIAAEAKPELWKLVFQIIRKLGWKATTTDQRKAAVRAWWSTEYSPPMRAFITFFH